MSKFLKRLTFFVFILLPGYVFIIALTHLYAPANFKLNIKFKKGGNGHLYTRLREANTTKNIDILVLGSSHAYRGVDPRIFYKAGYRLFNLGSSSQTHIQTEYLVKQYLDKLNPKIVLYEVYPNTLQNDGFESFIDLASNCQNPFELWKMAIKINKIPAYNTWIASLIDFNLNEYESFSELSKNKLDTYIAGGYVEKQIDTFSHKKQVFQNRLITPKKYQVDAFENVLDYLNQQNIKIVLFQAPITKDYYQTIENRKELDKFYQQYVDNEYVNLYINFNNKDHTLNDNFHYYDKHHLNQEGVEIFNKMLIEEIE
ncbi:hypothetical protein [Marivirga sp.]|uniref:hypothetical protein n=1 Tax=Marivirga sp. TaxID=2018662 RepID=UPI002D7FEB15|nr:hypothetical protein [Marivirga sp.]HET8860549.1 hypothetical protein [Marivirga sp.]